MIIFGTKTIGSVSKTGMFYCPNCKKDQPYKLMRYKRYFHLFFIPIFPIKDLGDGLECMNCHTSFVPNSVSFKEESDLKHIVVAPDLISPTSANFSKRVGAYIIDYILIYILYIALYSIGIVMWPLIIILTFLYFLLCDIYSKGSSLGKLIFTIKVSELDADKVPINSKLIIRNLIKTISSSIPIIFLFALTNEDKQALHDKAADSIVIDKIN